MCITFLNLICSNPLQVAMASSLFSRSNYNVLSMQQCLLLSFFLVSSSTLALIQPKCNSADLSALLHFKNRFQIDCNYPPSAYPKTLSWNNKSLGAHWDGVQCDPLTGHVIGINLSSSCLHGSINSTIFSRLVHLQYLNLAHNDFGHSTIPPELGNLSRLAYLDLSESFFVGAVPLEISKLSELSSLDLSYNELEGELPAGIFHLPNLQVMNIRGNRYLKVCLPHFTSSSHLVVLQLHGINFGGRTIPSSMGNLVSLKELHLSSSNLSGSIPSSLGNLTQLITLGLSYNNFFTTLNSDQSSLSWLRKLTKLESLYLSSINLQGEIPSFLANLTQLSKLILDGNGLHGEIPAWLANLTQLSHLILSSNNLRGTMPNSFFNMTRLEYLGLSDNNLSGPLPIDMFFRLKYLTFLHIPGSGLTIISRKNTSERLEPNLQRSPLSFLDISFNKLQGSLPIPPSSLQYYVATNMDFTGGDTDIPASICSLSSLQLLYFKNNHLIGELPHCFGKLASNLQILYLKNNSLHGRIPELCLNNGSRSLRMIDLSNNRLEGHLPRSLSKCFNLEFLNVDNNLIKDTFPSWLGSLPHLKVLALKHNELHGSIEVPNNISGFAELRIIDLSYNNLSGELPSMYFQGFDAMKTTNLTASGYMYGIVKTLRVSYIIGYSLALVDKGIELQYPEILDTHFSIDLSHNRFVGTIPRILGDLRGLHLLNLSYNLLTGPIPTSLAELRELQSLDLSSNRLSGGIPQQLAQITFLSIFNVSYNNNLTGPIPQGRQFDTFDNRSYIGDRGLCGRPLSINCGNSPMPDHVHTPTEKQNKFLDSEWMVVLIGFGGGLIVGIAMENVVDLRTRILSWIRKERRNQRPRRIRTVGRTRPRRV